MAATDLPTTRTRMIIGGMIARKIGACVTVSLGVWTTTAIADSPRKKNPWLDLPEVSAARETAGKSYMWVKCQAIPDTSPRRARCTISQVFVNAPKSMNAELAKIIEPMARTGKWSKDAANLCKGAGKEKPVKTPELRDWAESVAKACKAKDAKAIAALIASAAAKDAKTCTLSFFSSEEVFTQTNEKTWTKTVTAICGTSVATLWRQDVNDLFWNYSQVMSVMPNAPTDTLLSCDKLDTRTDWLFWDRPLLPIGCEFLQ
jgi:hypothetical protein